MQKFVMVSRNSDLADDAASGSVVVIQSGRRPMAHQLNSVFVKRADAANHDSTDRMPHIETAHPHGDRGT